MLDIIVPVYNEKAEVVFDTLARIERAFANISGVITIVVNDGSDVDYPLELPERKNQIYVRHSVNKGYGSALKTGILSGRAPWIAIVDADGTYPVEELVSLYKQMPNNDMVIGTRTSKICQIPFLRRFPKFMLNLLASYMAGVRIRDLNSGMRIFSRDLAYYLWDFFPKGFSFTSTITMGAIMGGFRIHEVPIDYFKRAGSSSIRPVRDTIRFFRLVCRLGLIFEPLRIFGPVALILLLVGLVKGLVIDYRLGQQIGNFAVMCILTGAQIFMMGLLAKLIVHSRFLGYSQKNAVIGTTGKRQDTEKVLAVTKVESSETSDQRNTIEVDKTAR